MKDCRHSGGLRINRSSRQSASPPTQEIELGTRCYQPNVMNVSCVKQGSRKHQYPITLSF